MKIAITGASGFIGKEIIPYFERAGVELLLIGRDQGKLNKLFPDINSSGYSNLEKGFVGCDAVLHLAVLNNDQSGSFEDFQAVNVGLLKTVVNAARRAGLKSFFNLTTLHAVDEYNESPYARSKREADIFSSSVTDISIINIRLPAVYGSVYKGKLSVLNHLPRFLRPLAFQILASMKPTVDIKYVFATIVDAVKVGESADLLVTDRQAHNFAYKIMSKLVDLAFVFVVIFGLWWALIAAWMAVKFTSPGAGILAQERVGKNGKIFKCYKFRTMQRGTKHVSTHQVDPKQITTVGRFLRRTKIDELPQFWNILKNEMSLIGPRPCLPAQDSLIAARKERGVLSENGGITGWAQIKNVDMSDAIKLAKLDAEYIALRTIPLDLKILVSTAIGHGQGDKTL